MKRPEQRKTAFRMQRHKQPEHNQIKTAVLLSGCFSLLRSKHMKHKKTTLKRAKTAYFVKKHEKIQGFIKIIFDLFGGFRYLYYFCNRLKKVSVPKASFNRFIL